MTDHPHIYQAMFLLDNGEVREQGFTATRDWVKSTLEKHGAEVKVLRLWGERPLAYPIQGRNRATYLLGWFTASQGTVSAMKREMYLLGPVFRLLVLREDEIPAEELAYGIEELRDADLVIPEDVPQENPFFSEQPEPESEADLESAEDDPDAADSEDSVDEFFDADDEDEMTTEDAAKTATE